MTKENQERDGVLMFARASRGIRERNKKCTKRKKLRHVSNWLDRTAHSIAQEKLDSQAHCIFPLVWHGLDFRPLSSKIDRHCKRRKNRRTSFMSALLLYTESLG